MPTVLRRSLANMAIFAVAVYDPVLFAGLGVLIASVRYLLSLGVALWFQFGTIATIVYALQRVSGA
jgi:hypothetical protein